jgi:hypothetical protein
MPNKPESKLKQDSLVEQLVPDPANPQPTVHLTGWLGKSTEEGQWRLYLTPQLDSYVEFPESSVVHSQALPKEESALGGTTVWLKAGTALNHTNLRRHQVQAEFLSGAITSGFLGGAAAAMHPMAGKTPVIPGTTRGYQCSVNPHIPACQPRTYACPIQSDDAPCGSGAFCGTGAFVCGYSVGCTRGTECSQGC